MSQSQGQEALVGRAGPGAAALVLGPGRVAGPSCLGVICDVGIRQALSGEDAGAATRPRTRPVVGSERSLALGVAPTP